MLTYFHAIKSERLFAEYKRLTLAYWQAQPEDVRGWMARDLPALENEESRKIRDQIVALFEQANEYATRLRIPVGGSSFPPRALGGPVIRINLLYGAFDRKQGYKIIPKQEVLDGINRCLAQATRERRRLFWRQLMNPLWWLTEIIAYILRIPFMILRRAGVPANVEESIWGHMVKVGVFLIILLVGLHYGLDLDAKDILKWIK